MYVTLGSSAAEVLITSTNPALLPEAFCAIQLQVESFPTQSADAVPDTFPFAPSCSSTTNPVRVAVQTRRTEVAFAEVHCSVNGCPAVIVEGTRLTSVISGAAAFVVIVSVWNAGTPTELVAVQVHVDELPAQPCNAVPLSGPCKFIGPFDVKPEPVDVHTRLTDTACFVDQVSV